MFHIPHPLQADLPYLALVSDRLPVHGSPVAVCAVAASSPYYYFWDPAGFTADGSVEDFKRRRATEIKHGRIWAPVGLLQPTIGTTFSRRSLLPTDGACMISFWPYAWCLSRVDGNRLMHAMNGNSFCHVMLALMYVLLCIFTFEADTTLLLIDFAFCAVVHVMIALATVKKGRTCNRYLMPGRKVKGARYSCARRSKSGRKNWLRVCCSCLELGHCRPRCATLVASLCMWKQVWLDLTFCTRCQCDLLLSPQPLDGAGSHGQSPINVATDDSTPSMGTWFKER